MEYLIKHGSDLPPYLVTCLSGLVCRITSLSWMTDQRQRNILNQMLDFTKSREHCVLALQVLEELVNQINPSSLLSLFSSSPERSKMNETKTAIQFRDSNLMNIIGLAFNMLADTYQADDATVGTPELRMKLFQYSLQLLLRCLSFDCRMSGSEMTSDNLPVMLLPESWLASILTDDHMSLLFNMSLLSLAHTQLPTLHVTHHHARAGRAAVDVELALHGLLLLRQRRLHLRNRLQRHPLGTLRLLRAQ